MLLNLDVRKGGVPPPPDRLQHGAREVSVSAGVALAAVAGSVDGYGLSRVGHYVSHMSGTTSLMAQALAQNAGPILWLTLSAAIAFVCGAGLTGVLSAAANGVTRLGAARLLAVETVLITLSLIWSLTVPTGAASTLGLMLLFPFAMGLQNALAARFVRHHPRTTHVTGTLTSLGYHLGRLARPSPDGKDKAKVTRSAQMFAGFLGGGFATRLAYGWVGVGVLAAPAATAAVLSLLVLLRKLDLSSASTTD